MYPFRYFFLFSLILSFISFPALGQDREEDDHDSDDTSSAVRKHYERAAGKTLYFWYEGENGRRVYLSDPGKTLPDLALYYFKHVLHRSPETYLVARNAGTQLLLIEVEKQSPPEGLKARVASTYQQLELIYRLPDPRGEIEQRVGNYRKATYKPTKRQ